MRRTLFLLVALAALTACNPRLYPPQVETPDNYLYAGLFRQDSLAGSEEWWHVFRDPTLDSLISQALANNRDLAVAYSRVEEADRQIAVARAGFLPSFGVGVSAEGDYNAETKIVQKYAVEPQMTWEVSLFGALRNSTRAARAELLSSQWALRGVMLSLTAEVATTYFQLLGYRRNLRIAERSYALRRESAALIDSMYRHGMANGVALQQARSLVYTAAADIPTYRRAVAQMQLTLCTLLGENPQRPQGRAYASWRITGRSTCRWDFRRSCSNGDPTSWRLITIWKRLPTRPVMRAACVFRRSRSPERAVWRETRSKR